MLTGRLKDATRAELTKRGYAEAPQPQLLVNFSTNVENRTEVQSTGTSASLRRFLDVMTNCSTELTTN